MKGIKAFTAAVLAVLMLVSMFSIAVLAAGSSAGSTGAAEDYQGVTGPNGLPYDPYGSTEGGTSNCVQPDPYGSTEGGTNNCVQPDPYGSTEGGTNNCVQPDPYANPVDYHQIDPGYTGVTGPDGYPCNPDGSPYTVPVTEGGTSNCVPAPYSEPAENYQGVTGPDGLPYDPDKDYSYIPYTPGAYTGTETQEGVSANPKPTGIPAAETVLPATDPAEQNGPAPVIHPEIPFDTDLNTPATQAQTTDPAENTEPPESAVPVTSDPSSEPGTTSEQFNEHATVPPEGIQKGTPILMETQPETTVTTGIPDDLKLSLNTESKTLGAGKSFSLYVLGITGEVKYSSGNKKVASVSSAGKVTALTKGKTKITVTFGGEKLVCSVRVKSSPSAKVRGKAPKKSYTINKGDTLTVKISGKAKSVDNKYTTSNKKSVKPISKKSASSVTFKALSKGSAAVSVTVNKYKTFKFKIRVK